MQSSETFLTVEAQVPFCSSNIWREVLLRNPGVQVSAQGWQEAEEKGVKQYSALTEQLKDQVSFRAGICHAF